MICIETQYVSVYFVLSVSLLLMTMQIEQALQLSPEQMIRKLIQERWSQEKIANHLEVTQPTISRILSGKNKDPHFSLVRKLIAMLCELDTFDAA